MYIVTGELEATLLCDVGTWGRGEKEPIGIALGIQQVHLSPRFLDLDYSKANNLT